MSVERVIRNNVGREKRCFISLSFLFPDVLCATVVYRMLLLQQFRCIEIEGYRNFNSVSIFLRRSSRKI